MFDVEFKRISKILGRHVSSSLDGQELFAAIGQHFEWHYQFLQYELRKVDLRYWKQALNNIAVVSEVVKNRSIFCISCPRGYIERVKTIAFQSPGFSRNPPDFKTVNNDVNYASEVFAYTGVRMYRTHEVGRCKGIPK